MFRLRENCTTGKHKTRKLHQIFKKFDIKRPFEWESLVFELRPQCRWPPQTILFLEIIKKTFLLLNDLYVSVSKKPIANLILEDKKRIML